MILNFTYTKYFLLFTICFVVLSISPDILAQDYNIGTSTGPWAKIVTFLQSIVTLLGGPIAKFILFVSLVIFVAAWIWAPSSGAVGGFFRLLIGIIVIINAGLFLTSLGA